MVENNIIIDINNISVKFNISKEKIDNIKEYVIKLLRKQLMYREFIALDGISFSIKRGEVVGLLGLNGSGKSTLLKVIAGVLKPTKGNISVKGSIAPLIELGAGFNPNLSGLENIFLNGYLLGYDKKYIEENIQSIIEFSELGEFIDVPVKNYSSGMKARLGFAVATTVNPNILLVDEVLSVGDFKFQEKCQNRINEMMKNNATVLFVSHSISQVEKLCSRCIWLEKGRVVMDDNAKDVCRAYSKK